MKIWLLNISFIVCKISVLGQVPDTVLSPEVGKLMPELTIRNIRYYPQREVNIRDFKGKWLLLDFWNIRCGACIASFPHINEISKVLADSVQVMLVGIQDEGKQIEPMYKKFRERLHLLMPCAFDSLLANRLDIYVAPHYILIDDKGVVRCVTSAINADDVRNFLAGNPPVLPGTYRRMHDTSETKEKHYDCYSEKPFLINGNLSSDTDFLFRSVLSIWDRNRHGMSVPSGIEDGTKNGMFQVAGAPLEWLYNYANFGRNNWGFHDPPYGKDYAHPVLEISDSSKFKYSFKYSRNMYSYSLIMPPGLCTDESMRNAIERDLETYFGYTSRIERRNCPCLKLVVQKGEKEKLVTKGKAPYYKQLVYRGGFIAANFPIKKLVDWIRYNQQDSVILDETGIIGNIDIHLDCIPSDLGDLKKALHDSGLDLISSETPMRVVVIRDREKSIPMK